MDISKIKLLTQIQNSMLKYQKENNIKKNCVTNTQVLYDIVKNNYPELQPKAKTFICYYKDCDESVFYTHLLIEVDLLGYKIIEPSYDVIKHSNVVYFENFINLKNSFANFDELDKDEIKTMLTMYLELKNVENKINNGMFQITSLEYYNNLIDYIQHDNSFLKEKLNCDFRENEYKGKRPYLHSK